MTVAVRVSKNPTKDDKRMRKAASKAGAAAVRRAHKAGLSVAVWDGTHVVYLRPDGSTTTAVAFCGAKRP